MLLATTKERHASTHLEQITCTAAHNLLPPKKHTRAHSHPQHVTYQLYHVHAYLCPPTACSSSRVCSTALWVLGEYSASVQEIEAAVEVIKGALGPPSFLATEGEGLSGLLKC